MKSKFTLGSLLLNNKFILFFSIIASIALWIFVSPDGNRSISVTVNVSTEKSAVGALGLQVVEGQGQKVTVQVSGKRYIISLLKDSDIAVSVSLANVIAIGEYDLQLSAMQNSGITDYQIVKITPSTIKVKFDRVAEKTFPLTAEAIGSKASTGLIAEAPIITNTDFSTIKITGPQADIDKITSAVCIAEVNETLSQTKSFKGKIVLRDVDGKEIDATRLTLQFAEADITVQISKSKVVPINASFINAPGAYSVTPIKYTLNVNTIKVTGPPEIIDTLNLISLSPIDFTKINLSADTFTFPLVLPAGIKSSDDIKKVTVKLDLSGYSKKTVNVKTFIAINKGNNQTVAATSNSKSVVIVGPADAIAKVKDGNVYLEYDMTQVSSLSGQYKVFATVKAVGFSNIWGFGTYQVEVTIS